MINLIPPHAQKEVRKEYWIRVISVWIILCASACLIVAVLYAPVYVLVRSQLDAYQTEYAQASVESESFKDSENEITRTNELAILLSSANKAVAFSGLIQELEALSGTEITITEYLFSRTEKNLNPVTITGIAQSRLALTSFQDALNAHPQFQNAQLPLSNLARDRDVPFSITVEPEVIKP